MRLRQRFKSAVIEGQELGDERADASDGGLMQAGIVRRRRIPVTPPFEVQLVEDG
jgi:hypothetical protein